ncbi:MAG: deoxyribose-phosphate aldolase [Flavobacteriaceae bacterium]|nr:deoxyribose-phosphate aldolase [Flavobacteriaceae bacterium]
MKILLTFFLALLIISCGNSEKEPSAQAIIDKAIQHSCNGNCENATIDFTFRDRCYISKRKNGKFQLERITIDSTGVTHDILTNENFRRYKNDQLQEVVDSMALKYSNSVNSVHYFAQLPFSLNAPAVIKDYLGEDEINGERYHEIGVSFKQEGGGTDFQDKFVYWIHQENFTVDYLAYSYETDGGGVRFREAFNERIVKGIRFVDYNNYKPNSLEIPLEELDDLFQQGKLELLSKIETEAVGVMLDANL